MTHYLKVACLLWIHLLSVFAEDALETHDDASLLQSTLEINSDHQDEARASIDIYEQGEADALDVSLMQTQLRRTSSPADSWTQPRQFPSAIAILKGSLSPWVPWDILTIDTSTSVVDEDLYPIAVALVQREYQDTCAKHFQDIALSSCKYLAVLGLSLLSVIVAVGLVSCTQPAAAEQQLPTGAPATGAVTSVGLSPILLRFIGPVFVMTMVNQTIVMPASESKSSDMENDVAFSGLIIGSYGLGVVVSFPFFLYCAYHSYRLGMLVVGITAILGNLLYAFAHSPVAIICARMFCGLEGGVIFMNQVIVQQLTQGEGLLKATAMVILFPFIGLILGPVTSSICQFFAPWAPPEVPPSLFMVSCGIAFTIAVVAKFPDREQCFEQAYAAGLPRPNTKPENAFQVAFEGEREVDSYTLTTCEPESTNEQKELEVKHEDALEDRKEYALETQRARISKNAEKHTYLEHMQEDALEDKKEDALERQTTRSSKNAKEHMQTEETQTAQHSNHLKEHTEPEQIQEDVLDNNYKAYAAGLARPNTDLEYGFQVAFEDEKEADLDTPRTCESDNVNGQKELEAKRKDALEDTKEDALETQRTRYSKYVKEHKDVDQNQEDALGDKKEDPLEKPTTRNPKNAKEHMDLEKPKKTQSSETANEARNEITLKIDRHKQYCSTLSVLLLSSVNLSRMVQRLFWEAAALHLLAVNYGLGNKKAGVLLTTSLLGMICLPFIVVPLKRKAGTIGGLRVMDMIELIGILTMFRVSALGLDHIVFFIIGSMSFYIGNMGQFNFLVPVRQELAIPSMWILSIEGGAFIYSLFQSFGIFLGPVAARDIQQQCDSQNVIPAFLLITWCMNMVGKEMAMHVLVKK